MTGSVMSDSSAEPRRGVSLEEARGVLHTVAGAPEAVAMLARLVREQTRKLDTRGVVTYYLVPVEEAMDAPPALGVTVSLKVDLDAEGASRLWRSIDRLVSVRIWTSFRASYRPS